MIELLESPSNVLAVRAVGRLTKEDYETLSKIAKHYYGNANAWPKIFDANKDKLKNPDLIHPGQVLKIPA